MGIQDRDYYREKYNKAARPNVSHLDNPCQRQKSRHQTQKGSSSLRYLLLPALMLFALWHGADRLLQHKAGHRHPSPAISISKAPAEPKTIAPIAGGLLIKADRQGHYRGTVLINDIPMPFLIDTGATKTTIPAKLADAARLPVGAAVKSNTAGGQVTDRLTQISRLKIGNAVITNLDANINEHLDEVLIGMNTLKYFTLSQSGNTLALIANRAAPEPMTSASAIATMHIPPNALAAEQSASRPEIKRPTTIKKTVTCDAWQVCTTTYSDQ